MPPSLNQYRGTVTSPGSHLLNPYQAPMGGGASAVGPDDNDNNMDLPQEDNDSDYNPATEGRDFERPARRKKRQYSDRLRKLDRKQRALCRELCSRRHRLAKDVGKIFGVTEPTVKRAVQNNYIDSGKDNLESDDEHIGDDDVLQKLKQLDHLPAGPMPVVAHDKQIYKRKASGKAPRPAMTSRRGKPVRATGIASTSDVTDPIETIYAPNKEELVHFLKNLGFSNAQIACVLPPLEEGGITDDETFRQIIAWPESDIELLVKELEANKRLNTVQKIRIKRGIYDRRKEIGLTV
ncbi:hypothetical protein HYDPIDRAFT_115650 [Hydnomerulius pinastri MD-312]|uniref:Uncharacterized protein n=1 Tax=Hydnomerulius pinastri MD-312 TaxID=994086 RepID=A0A0C9W4R2_9AGAM|nr:hypothetical protein HYDPIDRAFT_115650 [Hydnomerulius pinastri MD-312]